MQAYFPQTFGSHQKDQLFTPEVQSILPLDVIRDYYRQEESPDEHHQSLMIEQHPPTQSSFHIQYDPKYQRKSLKVQESPFKRKLQNEIHEINQSILQEQQQQMNKENIIPKPKPKPKPKDYQKQTQVQLLDYDSKYKLINWLYQIDLLKSTNSLVDKMPKLAKSGVFLCDLLNRLNGKIDPLIKGIIRKPKGRQMKHNWLKVFDQLKQNQRMNSRYLFCENILSSEHDHPQYEDIFWGLLQDIFTAYTGKKTPRRQSNPVNPIMRTRSQVNTVVTQTTQQNEFSPIKKSPSPMKMQSPVRASPTGRYSSIHIGRKQSNVISKSPNKQIQQQNTSQNISQNISQTVTQRQVRQSTKSSIQSNKQQSLALVNLGQIQVIKISQIQELDLRRWIEMMNLGNYLKRQNVTLFEDASRNGVLLCKLVIQLGMIRGSTKLHYNPKNILDCQENWEKGLQVFDLGRQMEKTMEKLMAGCRNTFFSLMMTIKNFQDKILQEDKQEQEQIGKQKEIVKKEKQRR